MAGKVVAEIWLDVRPYNGGSGTGPGGGIDDGTGTAIVDSGLNAGIIVDTIGGGITFMGAGSIKGGKTAYDVGQGFWFGADGQDPLYYKVAIGDPSGDTFNWDGTEINSKMNNLELRGYLRGPADFVIDPATHGDNTGEVTIAGNLEVAGGTIKGPAELIIDPATHGDDTGTVNIKGATLKVPDDFTIDPAVHGNDTGSLVIAGASLKVPNNFAIDPATHGDNTGTLVVSGNVEVAGGTITGPATIVIDPAVVGANSGLVQILGDLQVDGLTTTINSSVMTVDDKNVVIGEGATNAAAVNLGGFTLEGANATILYTSSDDKWNLNKGLNITGDLEATGALKGQSLDIGSGDLTVNSNGDLVTNGSLTVNGATNLNGNTTVGDTPSDTIFFYARVTSSFAPTTTNTYDLGSTSLRWNTLWVNRIFAAELDVGAGDFVVDADGNLDANGGTFASLTIDSATPGTILKQVNAQGTAMSIVAHTTMNIENVSSSNPGDATVLKYNNTSSEYQSVDFKTTSLEDVSTTTASDNQILKYNAANTQYEPVDHTIRELEDVANTAPANDQILQYNSTSGEYEPEDFVLDTLTDVTIVDLADGDLLVYQSATSDWRNKTKTGAGFHAIALSGSWADLQNTPTTVAGYGITDVYTKNQTYSQTEVNALLYTDTDVDAHLNRTSASNQNKVLSYNGSDYEWVSYGQIVGSVEELTDLSDVGLSSPSSIPYGDVLMWTQNPGGGSGGFWTDRTMTFTDLGGKPTTIAGYGITDFDTRVDTHLNKNSAGTDEILSWNGTDYAWVAGPSSTNLRDLNDVTQVGANNKDILRYNSTSSAWENDGFSIYNIGDLGNVANTAPSTNNLLVWNGSTWGPGSVPTNAISLALNDITDVSLGTLNTNDYLKYDGAAWVDSPVDWTHITNKPTILTTNDLYTDGDVDTHLNKTSAQTNQVLTWSGTDYSWTTPATGVSALNDLSDVTSGSPSTGQVLRYNGTNWAASSVSFADLSNKPTTIAGYGITDAFDGAFSSLTGVPGFAEDLGDLGDVTISGVADGHMIKYNSANSRWENTLATLASLEDTNITSPSNNHVLAYNSSNQKWESGTFSIGNLTNVNTGADAPSTSSSTTGASPAVLWYSSSSSEWNAAPLEIDDLYGVPDPAASSASVGDILAIKVLTHPQEYEWISPNTSSANLVPGTTNTYDIGTSSKVWRDLHLGRNIELGNITLSNNSGVFEVEGNAIATQAYVGTHVSTEIASLVDSAPGTLDTLNELAAALGDDPNFATTTATSLGNKLNTSDFTSTANAWLVQRTTDDLGEGSNNLYYTDTRARAAITAGTGVTYSGGAISIGQSVATTDNVTFNTVTAAVTGTVSSLSNHSTTNLSEGNNLYYTNARADARIANAIKDEDNMASDSATHVPSQQSVKAYIATQIATKDNSDEITEGSTNLYFTNARADARVALATGANLSFASKSTTDLSEGNNLYYTDARVQTKLGAVSGSIIPNANETYDLGSSTYKFRDLYLSGNTITLGSLTLSDSSGALSVSSGGSTASTNNLDVTGTIKLDGNFPTGTGNLAFGDTALDASLSGNYNTAIGHAALTTNTSGTLNTAVGSFALEDNTLGLRQVAVGYGALRSNTTGDWNIGIGYAALSNNTTADKNVAVGYSAGSSVTTGAANTLMGHNAGVDLTTGNYNTAVGENALANGIDTLGCTAIGYRALLNNTTTNYLTAVGFSAMYHNTTGVSGCAFGVAALESNTTGSDNNAFGRGALQENITGGDNNAFGRLALNQLTSGIQNTAMGHAALDAATTANHNTAFGATTLTDNTTGQYNTAVGSGALADNTTASYGVAVGYDTLDANTTGARNCAAGYAAMTTNTTGGYNTAFGSYALNSQTTPNFNVGIGYQAGYVVTTGYDNTFLGSYAGDAVTTGYNLTVIGYNAAASSATAANEVTLGNSSIGTLRAYAALSNLSDERDKKNIESLGNASDFIKALRPVSFDWNQRDGGKVDIPEHGFIAQELQAAQKETSWHVPNLVSDTNPDKLEAAYATLLPSIVSALQEALAEIESLKAEVTALKGERND